MQTKTIGKSGIDCSVIGLGTWAIGGWYWGGTDEKESIKTIQASINEGVNLIDTAPAYGLGLAETLVGKAIAGQREKVIISTKCGLVWHTQRGEYFFDEFDKPIHRYLGAESIRYETEKSLKRLNTDYIDVYFVHWMDENTDISETMGELLALKKDGKIRAIGISNGHLRHYKEYSQHGKVDAVQELYNILHRDLERDVLPYYNQHDIAMFAYCPLAQGLLTAKFQPIHKFSESDLRQNNPMFSKDNIIKVNNLLEEFKPIAYDYGINLSQLVTAWTFHQPGITHVLCGARNPEYALQNAKAGEVKLSAVDIDRLNDIAARHNLKFDMLEESPY